MGFNRSLPPPVLAGSGSAGRGHCSTASQSFDSPGMGER